MSVVEELKKLLSFTQKKMGEIISKEEETPAEAHIPETTVEKIVAEELKAEGEAEAKEAVVATGPKARKGRNGEVNKSEKIREYLAKHPEAGNQEVVEYLRKECGADVSPQFVSTIKSNAKRSKGPSARKIPAKGRGKGGLNKSQVVRDYFSKHEDASVNDVIAHLKEKYNTSVTPALIYSIKRSPLAKKGRSKAQERKKSERGEPMVACVTKTLSKFREGGRLSEIAENIQKSGKYHYAGDKGEEGFRATVAQALNDLSQPKTHPGWKGEVAVVLHDKELRRWKLNPKAKRESAA